MWFPFPLALVLGCSGATPDPDVLLHAAKVREAAAAFEEQTGRTLDFGHPAADGLARMAARDPSITCAEIERRMRPVLLLDQTPLRGTRTLDLTFPALAPVLAAAFDLGAKLVAVGRSVITNERAAQDGGALPWADGRVVGGADTREDALALGAALDADPPTRLVTVGMDDGAGQVFFALHRRPDGWHGVNSLTPDQAATWINFADYAAREGVERAHERYGARLSVAAREQEHHE